ncbi:hypothetical protein DICVIV_11184 [Dictyocaulus viviparus]|uniref:Uncharacterized protein n=1 Tax=Dictyocaulus viviparus TaxID=29172 RepID=A0A0D8XDW2_DICVI|nr:hypothetical protein DICVIV_11184 [Dictyocaulus viviparus]
MNYFSQIYGFPQGFPFNYGYQNPFFGGSYQGGVFSPNWAASLAEQIKDATKNARTEGITTVNGITIITMFIGGKRYSAQLPPYSSVTTQSYINYNNERQPIEEVIIIINGDVTVYRTVGGRTIVTDGNGNVRSDGGPFHIF